jgi:PKD repeat protein
MDPMLPLPRARAAGALALTLTTIGLASATAASAAPAWLGPATLSAAGQNADDPHVASAPTGDAVVVWRRSNGTHQIVQAATRPAGGAWSEPAWLSAAGQNATTPAAAVDASGTAVATWSRWDGVHQVIQAAVRPPGGEWPSVASTISVGDAYAPDVALDGKGGAVAVWRSNSGGPHSIVQAAYRAAGGAWQSPTSLSALGQNAYDPHIAVDGDGNALAAWDRFDGTHQVVQTAFRPAGGTWQAPVTVSGTGLGAQHPQVAFDGLGNALVAFDRDGTTSRVQVAVRSAAGSWQVPIYLSAAGSDATDQQVAADPQGDMVVAWDRKAGGTWVAEATVRAPGGTWPGAVALSNPGGDADEVHVGLDAQGGAVALWVWGATGTVQSASRPAGGAWGAPVAVAPALGGAYDLGLGVDAQGNAVAAWQRPDGSNDRVQVAGYDGAGPQLRAFAAPGSATVGAAATFAASPLDVWSTVASTTWDFGDGTAADGTTVTHAYGAPGTYAVTLATTDALGNRTTKTASIVVTAAGGGGGGGGQGGGGGGGGGQGGGGGGGETPRDTARPTVTLTTPACRKGLSKAACTALRSRTASWRTLRGTAADTGGSGVARVEVAAARKAGKRLYVSTGKRFAASTAKRFQTAYRPARLAGGHWSLALPKLTRGTYLLRIRAVDGAGNASAVATKTLTLR